MPKLPPGQLTGHMYALFAAVVWSTAFVASRSLINAGLYPVEIIFFRTVLAWLFLLALRPRGFCIPLSLDALKEEKFLILYGLFMLPLYFMLEHTALVHSTASNTSLMVATSPLFVVLISRFLLKRKGITKNFVIGALICFCGVFFVVSGGNFALEINPLGDLLAISAAMAGAAYTLIGERLGKDNYPGDIVVGMQRIFFYGIIMLLPVMPLFGFRAEIGILLQPAVAGQLIYLAVGSSAFAFLAWNSALGRIGALKSGLYVFLIPVMTIVIARIVLNEEVTIFSAVGAALILFGLAVSKNILFKRKELP